MRYSSNGLLLYQKAVVWICLMGSLLPVISITGVRGRQDQFYLYRKTRSLEEGAGLGYKL